MDPLLESRGKHPTQLYGAEFGVGARVQISGRCGDWGEDNLGIVKCVAEKPDAKGRYFVGVLPDGMRDHVGRPECAQLRSWSDYNPKAPPLPAFEAGLVKPVEA